MDIIFEGVDAHDRAGVAVHGDFDFNGDGTPDILIGAEQINRTGVPDPACPNDICGPGKVYLIFFDPLDTVHYPNIDDPTQFDVVDLSLVGQPGGIPGVVFTGVLDGDRAGFSLAGGGQVNAGTGDDIVIGAPGYTPAAGREGAGAAYVIFDDPTLVNVTVSLADVGGAIDGVVYEGTEAGDELGTAVAFPGDVIGTPDDDVALGAPLADTLVPDGGIVYVVEGGTLAKDTIEVCDVGGSGDNAKAGMQMRGTQAGERLGTAVAGGGDNLSNMQADLLVGAPFFDFGTVLDAGRVIQTGSKLPFGQFDADRETPCRTSPPSCSTSSSPSLSVSCCTATSPGTALSGSGVRTTRGCRKRATSRRGTTSCAGRWLKAPRS